jgi:hypothetical protein
MRAFDGGNNHGGQAGWIDITVYLGFVDPTSARRKIVAPLRGSR